MESETYICGVLKSVELQEKNSILNAMKEKWRITLPRARWAPAGQNATFHLSNHSVLIQADFFFFF